MDTPREECSEPVDDRDEKASLIAEYTVETPGYHDLLGQAPEMHFTLEQIVACGPETVSVTFWAEGGDLEAFETTLQQSDSITDVRVMDQQSAGRTLYQASCPVEETTYWSWTSLGGVLLAGTGTHESWTIRMRFPTHEALVAYRNHCKDRGIHFSLKTLHHETESPEHHRRITNDQYEVLQTAIEGGYFNVPRDITINDIAIRFDISDQAVSERLRRALSNHFASDTLSPTPD